MSGIIGSTGTKSGIVGIQQEPSKPAFCATFNGIDNLAVDTATYIAGTELFDIGGNLTMNATGTTRNSNGMTFTAPVSGKYQINAWIQISDYADNQQYVRLNLHVGSTNYYTIHSIEVGDANPASKYGTLNLNILDHMDAGDTCSPFIHQAAGSATLDTFTGQSCFSGFLVA